jgi:hypothetical protein
MKIASPWIAYLVLSCCSPLAQANPPAPSPAPAATVGPETIAPAEGKRLLSEFQRAQKSELKALVHRHDLEQKELKASQAARQNEWDRQEKAARHKFFSENPRGPDRRAYIKDFLIRGKTFRQMLKDEKTQRTEEQKARLKAMREDQAQRLKEFKEALGRNERPPARLWPS